MRLLLSAVAILALAACGEKAEEKASTPDPAAEAAAAAAEQEKIAAESLAASLAFLEENAKREGVQVTSSGLQYMVLEEGAEGGLLPNSVDMVDVHFVGTLIDGVEFDSSRARGAAARFRLNEAMLGMVEGLKLMTEGDRYRFFIPAELTRGEGEDPEGFNRALIYDVELLKVHDLLRNKQQSEAFLEVNAKEEGVSTTASGLQYKVLIKGPEGGKSPTESDTVKVDYQGTLINGTEFDSSYARGEPAEFPLNRVIAGWTEGVQLMSEGDKFRFFVPAPIGYGEDGTPGGPIAPNEALIFDVELIEVKAPEQQQ